MLTLLSSPMRFRRKQWAPASIAGVLFPFLANERLKDHIIERKDRRNYHPDIKNYHPGRNENSSGDNDFLSDTNEILS